MNDTATWEKVGEHRSPTVCQHVVVSFTHTNLGLPTRVGQHELANTSLTREGHLTSKRRAWVVAMQIARLSFEVTMESRFFEPPRETEIGSKNLDSTVLDSVTVYAVKDWGPYPPADLDRGGGGGRANLLGHRTGRI